MRRNFRSQNRNSQKNRQRIKYYNRRIIKGIIMKKIFEFLNKHQIPGFRTRYKWKSNLAIVGYCLIILFGLIIWGTENFWYGFLWTCLLIGLVFIFSNYREILNLIPNFSKNKKTKILTYIGLVIVSFIIIVIVGAQNPTESKITDNGQKENDKTSEEIKIDIPYELAEREVTLDPTSDTFVKINKAIKIIDALDKQSVQPIKVIKIYYKKGGIEIDIEKMNQVYTISDLNEMKRSIEESFGTKNKEEVLRIIVDKNISIGDLKKLSEAIIKKETILDNDIDELHLMFYDRKEDIDSVGYTLGWVYWGPKGDTLVSEKIAKNNEHNDYEIVWKDIRISENKPVGNVVTDNDREIFYRYGEIFSEQPIVALEDHSSEIKAKELTANEYNLTAEDITKIIDKISASRPTDQELAIYDEIDQKLNNIMDTEDRAPTDAEETQFNESAAAKYKITVKRAKAIYFRVMAWQFSNK